MNERDLPASIRSGASFNVYAQFSWIEDRIALLKDFCTTSTKRLLTQCLLHKYIIDDGILGTGYYTNIKARYRTQNLRAKLAFTPLVCNYTNKLSYQQTEH